MKKLTILEEIVLFLIDRYNGERTIQGITYLLKGKQSAQIIQDSHFYHVTSFFGVYHFLTHQNMQDIVNGLKQYRFINQIESSNDLYRVNESGQAYLLNQKLQFQKFKHINGLKFNNIQKIFWKRFSLFFQTISNINSGNKYFKAVQQELDIQEWVKDEILNFIGSKELLLNEIHTELYKILKQLKEEDAQIFVRRLTGANSYGMTLVQIASEEKKNEETIYLQSIDILHHILSILIDSKSNFPLMSNFIKGLYSENITNTSIETKRLFKEGKTIKEIASIRKLKVSTIEDHIVECVLSDATLPISQFINEDEFHLIKTKINELNTRKLKVIKEALMNKVSYFQIRITLARIGDLNGVR